MIEEPPPRWARAAAWRGGTGEPRRPHRRPRLRVVPPEPTEPTCLPAWLSLETHVGAALVRRGAPDPVALGVWEGVRTLALLCQDIAVWLPASRTVSPDVLRRDPTRAESVAAARELLDLLRGLLPVARPGAVPLPTDPGASGADLARWLLRQGCTLAAALGAGHDADPDTLRREVARVAADLSAHFDAWAGLLDRARHVPWQVPPV